MNRNTLLAGVFILALIASLLVSGYGLYSQSIRLDESQSIWVSTKPIVTIFQFVAQDVHVPLYEVILHFWMQIFGTGIVVVRTLSMIFFLFTLPVLYKLARESSDRRIALLTVLLFSLSPFIMWYSAEARMYSLFTFVASLNNLYFLRMMRSNGENGKLAYFASTVLGFYTHYFFIFLVVTQAIFVVSRLLFQASRYRELTKKDWDFPMKFFYLNLGTGALFLPWVVYFVASGMASNTQPLIPPPTSYNIFQTLVVFLFGFQSNAIQAVLISLWPLSIMLLFFVFTHRRKIQVSSIEYFAMATFLPIIITFAVSFIKPIFLSRYLIFVTPTLFFLLAWILMNYSKRVSSYLIAGLAVLMFGLLLYQDISAATPVKENYKGVSDYLDKAATPQDIIAVSAPFTVYPIEYTYSGSSRIDTIPHWDRYRAGAIPAFSMPGFEQQIGDFQKTYNDIFVVLSYDQGYESQIRNYLDHHYQLLFHQNFSPGLEVREYKLRY